MITPTVATPAVPDVPGAGVPPLAPPDATGARHTDLELVRAALRPDYDVLSELGRGGMATVYEGRERTLDRPVAIKVLPFTLAHDPELVERFQREARTAAQLEHPHIIPIHRVGRAGDVIYFVMQRLRGLSLSDRLLELGHLTAAETRRILLETASALGAAHRRGVVHRDIKPDNILLDEDGRCVVTDFGIARSVADTALTAAGTSMGTPRYMSPEQARAKSVDGRSDLYSLGAVGYQCLTGRLPFDGDDMMAILLAHVSSPVPRPAGLDAEQRAVYAVIERLLSKDPSHRFQSADELTAALSAARLTPATTGRRAATGRTAAAGPRMKPTKRADGGADMGRDAGEVAARIVRFAGRRLTAELEPGLRRLHAIAAADPRRAAALAGGAVLILFGGSVGVHFAVEHRSRCPSVADGAAPRFAALLDQPRAIGRGDDVEIHYDVCGLAKGTSYTARVSVTRVESGLRKLFSGAAPAITSTFEETARGAATRRHESIAMRGSAAGAYRVTLVVTDDKGRRRQQTTTLQITGDE